METFQAIDEGALFWCETRHSAFTNTLMAFITRLGNPEFLIGMAALGGILLLLTRRRRTAFVFLFVSLLAMAIYLGVGAVIQRERPDVAWRLIRRPHTPSFPSGHSLLSMMVYGGLALLASRRLHRPLWRVLVIFTGVSLSLVIGMSRPYLGVHYPSDVLAGWTAGLACALLAFWVDQRWGDRLLTKSLTTDFTDNTDQKL